MFIQVIHGEVSDAGEARAAHERWLEECAPGAVGWLGTTAGVTDDGQMIVLARFESADAAARNNDRPEQDAWWTQASKIFTGEVTFQNSTYVSADVTGNPDEAGFVQIMQGHGSDPERARELMNTDSFDWAAFRPELLGSVSVEHEGGAWTMAIYFTSEKAAREGEQKEPPAELKAQMDELNSLMTGPPTFFDLKDPWLSSPT